MLTRKYDLFVEIYNENLPITEEDTKIFSKYKKIIFNNKFNQPIDGKIPFGITHIIFECHFEIETSYIDNYPNNEFVENFEIAYPPHFNQTVDNLPRTITHLIIGPKYTADSVSYNPNKFNQPINNLPDSLIELYLGEHFNYPIDMLPANLKYLYVGESFNKSLKNLPSNLKKLVVNHQSIDGVPDSIEELKIENNLYKYPIKKLPRNLKILEIFGNVIDITDKIRGMSPEEFNNYIHNFQPRE